LPQTKLYTKNKQQVLVLDTISHKAVKNKTFKENKAADDN